MNNFELGILDFLAEHLGCPFLDFLMPIITLFGDGGIFWIALSVIFIAIPKTRKMGITMGFLIGNLFLKNVVGRIRPYDLNPNFALLVDRLHDYSFPSGHTLASFEAATAIFLYKKRLGIAALLLASLIAFSRLYLYVHYPTDVLASIILGVGIAILCFRIINKLYEKRLAKK